MPHAVPEQPQGQLGVLDVAVGQQQQIPEAAGGRQQAEGSQGPPQLGAAPYWSQALRRGGRRVTGGEPSQSGRPRLNLLVPLRFCIRRF